MSILNKDIDHIIIQFLEIDDLRNLYQVNKYYRDLIRPLLNNFIAFYSKIDNIDYKNRNYDVQIKGDILFNKAIIFGDLQICKYLLDKNKYDIHANRNSAFQISCICGHLNIAKWLYYFDDIHRHMYISLIFYLTIKTGHLDILKWLYSLDYIDITYDDLYFITSCKCGHLDVAKWLCSLNPDYILKINGNKLIPKKIVDL